MTKVLVKHKWQKNFIVELFELLFAIRGRFNFCNMSRYSNWNESTLRRNFSKYFDWISFNLVMIQMSGFTFANAFIAAIDCSYIPKAGKKTFGLDRFWSGVAGRAKKGLEISAFSLIDVTSQKAWTLDVAQTPSNLANKEGSNREYPRIDFYMDICNSIPRS
jgi:hypothetical protein